MNTLHLGEKRVFPKLLDWSSQRSVKHKRAAKAKIDMCNWLRSELRSSFHILPEPHRKLAWKPASAPSSYVQRYRATGWHRQLCLFSYSLLLFVRWFLQTCKPLTMTRGKSKRDVSLQCTGVWVGSNLRGRRWPGPDVLRWKCKCQKPPALLCSALVSLWNSVNCFVFIVLFLKKNFNKKKAKQKNNCLLEID